VIIIIVAMKLSARPDEMIIINIVLHSGFAIVLHYHPAELRRGEFFVVYMTTHSTG
jgi:hypothetical protein